jgi:peptide/nickel transport system substrate-binding protein
VSNRIACIFFALVIAVAAAGCGGAASSPPAVRDTLVIALNQEPVCVDPYMVSTPQGLTVSTLIHETLIKKAEDGSYTPWLATGWEQMDDVTFHFYLRDDVTFHDGSRFTAHDAAYSLAEGAESSFTRPIFGNIDPVNTRALDDYTLELKLTAPYAPLLEALSTFRGAMLCKSAREEMGEEAYGRAPVGTGPMRVTNWISGDRIEMEAHEGYWGEKSPFKEAVARFIVEGASRAIELETGGADIATDLLFSDWERISKNPDTVLYSGESQSHSFLLLNNSMEPTNSEQVRKALAHALDMESLVRVAYQGQASVADSFYTPNIIGYKKVGPYEYNPELSKQLLAQAGYPDGFEIEYLTLENQLNMACAEIIQEMWGAVGVRVSIRIIDLATLTELNNGGECPAAIMAPTVAMADPDAGLTVWPVYRPISIRHGDERVQELLDLGRSNYNEEERVKIYEELQDYLFEKCYSIPVAFPRAAFGASADIAGLDFTPSLVPDLSLVRPA